MVPSQPPHGRSLILRPPSPSQAGASLRSPPAAPWGRGTPGRLRGPPREGAPPGRGIWGPSDGWGRPPSAGGSDPALSDNLPRRGVRGRGEGRGRGQEREGETGIFSPISLFPHLQGAGAAAPPGGGHRRLQSAMRAAERVWHLYQAGYQPLCQAIWAWHVTGSSYHMRDGDWHASALGESRLPRDPPPSVTLYSKKKKN